MAQIQSGASADLLTVDPTSKAARGTLYDSGGRELSPISTGSYTLGFQVRHTTAAAANISVLNMRGPPSKTAYVKRIHGVIGFDGTALAASGTLRYGIYRGNGAVNTTAGGSRVAPDPSEGKKRSSYVNWTLNEFAYDLNGTGLTTTGITFETQPLHILHIPVVSTQVAAAATSNTQGCYQAFDLNWERYDGLDQAVELGSNQHLTIRVLTVAAIIGLSISGSIEWDER